VKASTRCCWLESPVKLRSGATVTEILDNRHAHLELS
jgi:hypothetical protein